MGVVSLSQPYAIHQSSLTGSLLCSPKISDRGGIGSRLSQNEHRPSPCLRLLECS
jgi:hypothetical protein